MNGPKENTEKYAKHQHMNHAMNVFVYTMYTFITYLFVYFILYNSSFFLISLKPLIR